MNAFPEPLSDPLAALPVLREAGVSVYWEQLDGRTAWVADSSTREVWLSRSIPPTSLLHYFIEALQAIDDEAPAETGSTMALVHSADAAEQPTSSRAELRVADPV